MNKLTSLLASLSVFLAACASAPTAPKTPGISGSLVGVPEVNLRAQPEPAKTSVQFDMKGYTIIGLAVIGVAVAKMNAQTSEYAELIADYNRKNPEQPTLQAAFNTELETQLKAHGVSMSPVELKRGPESSLPVRYTPVDATAKPGPTLVIDHLWARYSAVSSTDPYTPFASAMVTVMHEGKLYQEGVVLADKDQNRSFAGFGEIKENFATSYANLLTSVRNLAKLAAAKVLNKPAEALAKN